MCMRLSTYQNILIKKSWKIFRVFLTSNRYTQWCQCMRIFVPNCYTHLRKRIFVLPTCMRPTCGGPDMTRVSRMVREIYACLYHSFMVGSSPKSERVPIPLTVAFLAAYLWECSGSTSYNNDDDAGTIVSPRMDGWMHACDHGKACKQCNKIYPL